MIRLDAAGFADRAMADRALADAVAAHKSIFFNESTLDGKPIDYHQAVNGHLNLVPQGDALSTLANDYRRMVDDGLLLDDEEGFDELLKRCQSIQRRANAAARVKG